MPNINGASARSWSASKSRSRSSSIAPSANASYKAPCPRRNTGASDNSTSEVTGPSAQIAASDSSNSASARVFRQS